MDTAQNSSDYKAIGLASKTCLITGGTTGIGKATAQLLVSQGARVFIVGRDEQTLNDAIDEINQSGSRGSISGLAADVSSEDEIQRVLAKADEELGQLDILINNAALAFGDIQSGSYADWQYIINTNLLAYLAFVHEASERMKSRGKGHIINIGSMSADVREKGSSVYVATKAGIQGFSEAVRKELNSKGIKISLIEPGAVNTDMQPYSEEEKEAKVQDLEMLSANDIAACVLYTLAQPDRCDVVSVQIRPHLQLI